MQKKKKRQESAIATFRADSLWVLACKMSLSLAFSTALLTLGLVVFIILVIKRVLSTSSIDVRICALF